MSRALDVVEGKSRGLKRPPAIIDSIGQLAVVASGVHRHDAFKAMRLCETALKRIACGVAPPKGIGNMTDDLAELLRAADETIVAKALSNACVSLPITNETELLEAFNCILDVLGVPDADGDVFECADDDA